MTAWGWKPPSNHSAGSDLGITPQASESHPDNESRQIPAVFAGLDKAEALAYVSRMIGEGWGLSELTTHVADL